MKSSRDEAIRQAEKGDATLDEGYGDVKSGDVKSGTAKSGTADAATLP